MDTEFFSNKIELYNGNHNLTWTASVTFRFEQAKLLD